MSEQLRDVLKVLADEGVSVDNMEVIMRVGEEGQSGPGPITNPDGNGDGGTTPPLDPNDNWWTVVLKPSGNWPVYRTNTAGDSRKRTVKPIPGQRVHELTPPKKIHNTPIWSNQEELDKVLNGYAWLPRQIIKNSGGVPKILPFDWDDNSGKNSPEDNAQWQGGFVERHKQLKA